MDDVRVPPFPTDVLPLWVRDYVEAVAEATQTPVDLASMLSLSNLAAAGAKRFVVQVSPDWREPVNLFTVTAMNPAERKSAVYREVTRPLVEFEAAQLDQLGPVIAEQASLRRIAEQALAAAERSAAKKPLEGQTTFLSSTAELARELADMEVTAPPRLVVDDCSSERLASLMAEQRGRIAVMAAEGDVFDLMSGRYSPTGMANFGVYLRGHAGDDLRIDRVGRSPEFVRAPALTVGLTVQPEVIRGLARRPGFRGRGLLARFLYSLPPSRLGRRVTDPEPVPQVVRDAFDRNLTALLRLERNAGKDDWGLPKPWALALSPEAAASFRAFREQLEPRLGVRGDLEDIQDWAGKLAGAVARIAGLLHIATYATATSEPWSRPIGEETMRAAVRLGQEYLIPHAQAAFALMDADPALADTRHVLRVIGEHGLQTFTQRDLFQSVKGRIKTMEALIRTLAALEEDGFIRKRPQPDRPGPGRKPSPMFEVNPIWRTSIATDLVHGTRSRLAKAPVLEPLDALAHNPHNPQNAWCDPDMDDSEHCEDCERPRMHLRVG